MTKKKTITFGEVMGRISPIGYNRFRQALPGKANITFAGAEANVAVSIAHLGGDAAFVSAVPENPIAEACISILKSFGVDTSQVVKTPDGRFGLYYVERGANQRPSRVTYDRMGSSFALTPSSSYDWDKVFSAGSWFHISGITPAVSEQAATCSLDAVQTAKKHGLTVSCDLNFRKNLWRWAAEAEARDLAERTMRKLLPFVDIVIANEEDAADVLGIQAGNSDIEQGQLDLDRYPDVAAEIVRQFPAVSKVAITLRESVSASHNNWGAMLYVAQTKTPYFSPLDSKGNYNPYEIRQIIDRVGGGDSFAASLVYALQTVEYQEPSRAIAFATAASCLAHSIEGDFNINSKEEIEALLLGHRSGRVIR